MRHLKLFEEYKEPIINTEDDYIEHIISLSGIDFNKINNSQTAGDFIKNLEFLETESDLDIIQQWVGDLQTMIQDFPFFYWPHTEDLQGFLDDIEQKARNESRIPLSSIIEGIGERFRTMIDYVKIAKLFEKDPGQYSKLKEKVDEYEDDYGAFDTIWKELNNELPDWVKRSINTGLWDMKNGE